MKNHASKLLLLLIFSFLCLFLNPQNTPAQAKTEPINLNDILAKLTFTSRISKSAEQINDELIKEIRERKVDFILVNEKEIEKAGGNEILIKTIRENRQAVIEKESNFEGKSGYITLDEIKSKISDESKNKQSKNEIIRQLIKEIRRRKVDFFLSEEDGKYLRENGGSALLIAEIDKNTSERLSKWIKESQILYEKYTDNYRGNFEQQKIAYIAGKEFIEKYGNSKEFELQVEYLKKAIPKLEPDSPEPDISIYRKFYQSFKNKNWDDLFETGAKILDREPEYLDVSLLLASVGFDNLVENSNPKFLKQTLYYAEKSIELLEKSKPSRNSYGIFEYQYKTEKFPDGRANALGWMHYFVGYIKHFHLAQKQSAVSYLYKSTTYNSEAREKPIIYMLIGEFYLEKLRLLEDRQKRQIEDYANEKIEPDAKTDALSERAIDAFARAYSAAESKTETDKQTNRLLFNRLREILKKSGKDESNEAIDRLILKIIALPMPDPSDEISPL